MMRRRSERDIEQGFRDIIKRHGGLALKFVSPGMAGVPDRPGAFTGWPNMLLCRAQSSRKKVIAEASENGKAAGGAGHRVWVIDGPEKIAAFLQEV